MDVDLSNMPITDLIPQRPPFVLVDCLKSCCMTDAVTELTVRSDNIFCEDGKLSQPGMLENMAQSCAARMGWLCLIRDEDVKIGMIGEIKDCSFFRQPKVGEIVTTHVHIAEDIFNLTLASAVMRIGEEVVAQTTMKIALVNNMVKTNNDDTESDKAV